MIGKLHSYEEVSRMIKQGKVLVLAGDENVLSKLPNGNWIAGTIPYFMTENGGKFSTDELYVTELPEYVDQYQIKVYNPESIFHVYQDAMQNGFSLIIIPGSCKTHHSFALNAPKFTGFGTHVLVGWIAGFDLNKLGSTKPKVYDGRTSQAIEDGAIVLHISIPKTKVIDVGIINVFEQSDGDLIAFEQDGFEATTVRVNGNPMRFSDYIQKNAFDTKLPLVANFLGAMVNTSIQSVDSVTGAVRFYAPVFKGVQYRHAKIAGDYVNLFTEAASSLDSKSIYFSCNCILNYLYCNLEGKKTSTLTGPITFGEIAYQLLNQTLVYVTIEDARRAN